jgi:hypothetical protein
VETKDIALIKVGTILHHRFLGLVQYTRDAAELQKENPDPTSIFVQYRGAVIEVSVHLVDKAGA